MNAGIGASTPSPNPGPSQTGPGVGTGGGQGSNPVGTFDPWSWTPGAAAAGPPPTTTNWHGGPSYSPPEAWGIRTKDLAHIQPFDGELPRRPDWSYRILAKLSKAHPRMEELMKWAGRRAAHSAHHANRGVRNVLANFGSSARPPPLRQEAECGGGASIGVLGSVPAGLQHGVRRCATCQTQSLLQAGARCAPM